MLYQLRELQRSVALPMAVWAKAVSTLYERSSSPLSHLPLARPVAAGFELLHRLLRDYGKPAFGLVSTVIDGHDVPLTERVVLDKPFCRLVKFERALPDALARRANDPVVLLFAPLSGHFATLLRDTIRSLVPDHVVYVTDWCNARDVPVSAGPFHLEDYVAYAVEFMRALGPEVHVIAVCQRPFRFSAPCR